MLVLFLTLLILTLPDPAPALAVEAERSPQPTNSRASRDTKPKAQPIKVVISDSCAQSDSAGTDKELELDPNSPLVLTHRIRLVPTSGGAGGGGTCGGCEAEFAALRERLERLEREVSALREKCGGPEGGCCTPEQSKGPGCTVRPATCPDDCNDQGRCVDGKCVCFTGYSGEDCSESACPDNCSNKGQCVNGQCVCDPGFTGPDCSTRTCPNNCNNRGQCVNGRCVCDPGFAEPDCATQSCPGNCKNRGQCVNGQCVCNPGFTGPDCSLRACPDNCNNRGKCVNGKCVCDSGFTGPDCSRKDCPTKCKNRGKCVNGQCVCDTGFTGPDCSTKTCPDNCNNRGQCVNGKCVCDSGFTGPDCSEATCPDNCNNRGQCVNGKCVCDSGFTGPDCSEATCPDNCNNRGQCVNGKCVCDSGFTGPDCSEATCPDNCNNRGQCVNGKCVCDSGFTGPDCSTRDCPNNCKNRGKCVNGQCVCDPGFTGPDCSTKTCPDNCNNRGRCVNGKCVCDVGFSGPDCGTKSCPNNCSNKGRCVRGKCVCRPRFTGPDCSECEVGLSGPDCSTALTGVTSLIAKDITESSVTLTWTPPAVQYDTYHITFTSQKEGDQKITSSVGGHLTNYTQTGLAAGQEYHVSITGEKDGQTGAESTTDFITLISGPINLELVKTSTTYAIIRWEPPQTEPDRYHLSVSPSGGGDQGRQEKTLPPSRVSAQIDHLTAGVVYDVTLVAEKDGGRSRPSTIKVVPGKSGDTLHRVTTETKSRPVATDSDRPKFKPVSKSLREGQPGHEGEDKGRNTGTRLVTSGQTKPLPKPGVRNGTIRRPGMPRPPHSNATRPGTAQKRVPPKQPGTYPGKPRWTSSQPDVPTNENKPQAMTVTETKEDKGSLEGPDSGTSTTVERRVPTTSTPKAIEVSGNRTELDKESSTNTTGHPSGKKCHPKLIVGHRLLNGTVKARVPVIRNISHATDDEKVDALMKELQKHSTALKNTSSGEQGINLHISVFDVSPINLPKSNLTEMPLTRKTSAEVDNGQIFLTKLSLGLPLTLSTPTPSQSSHRRSEAAASRSHDSREYGRGGSGKSDSEDSGSDSDDSDSTKSSDYIPLPSRTPVESPRTDTVIMGTDSETGRNDGSDTEGSKALKPSGFPKGKFTRRPIIGPFQNRSRPFLRPPLSPPRGQTRRIYPNRMPNGAAINRGHSVQPGSEGTDVRTHPKQRPGAVFRTRNDTRPARPPPVRPASPHTTSTAPHQPSYTTTAHPDTGRDGHLDDKEKTSTGSPILTEEVRARVNEKPKAGPMRTVLGKTPLRGPGFNGGKRVITAKLKPGVTLRKRNGTVIRPATASVTSTKTEPPPTSHRTTAPHSITTAAPDSLPPTKETLTSVTAKTHTEDINLINEDTHPDSSKTSIPAYPGTAIKTKPKSGIPLRRKNGTIVQLPPGHKPIRPPLKKTDSTKTMDAPNLAHPTSRSPDGTQSSTTDGQERGQLSHVGVQNVSSNAVTLVWGAPKGIFKNFVVTQKRPTKEGEPENQVAEETEGTKEGKVGEQEGDLEDNEEGVATNQAEKPATTTDIAGPKAEASRNDTATKVLPGSARSFLFEGLRPQTQYVLSVFGTGPGQRSKTHSVTVNTGPEPPSNLLFRDITDTTVSVSWSKPRSPVTGFKVTYTHNLEGEPVSVSVGASDTTLDLSQLSPGSSYEVSVISLSNLDESDPLKDTVHTLPDPPKDLHAINITDSRALLLWRPALAAIDNYVIVYGSEKGPEMTISVSGNAAAQQLTGLEASTDYSVTITSHLGDRKSTGAHTVFTTTGGKRGDGPRDLTASQVTPRSATLTWKPPSSPVSGYKLQYAIEGQAFKDIIVGPDLSNQRLLRLRPDSKYIVRLQAEIGGVYSEAITTDFTTGYLRFPFPSDCSQELLNGVHESGLVEIFPHGQDSMPVSVYCDMETDGGGWTVLQRRVDGKVSFFRPWKDYRDGFGDPSEEFWMGNELIHTLTRMIQMSLRIDMRAEGESVYAKYSSFAIGPAKLYTLRVSGYTGNAGDSMSYHNGQAFSTRDRDRSDIRFCAMSYRGGWWYRNCHEANLNGLYDTAKNHQGIIWTSWKGKEYSIPFVEMKMRPAAFRPPSQG